MATSQADMYPIDDSWTVTKLSPFQDSPPFLGGISASDRNMERVAAAAAERAPAYYSLERMVTLPTPSFVNDIEDDYARDIYIRMCNGDFVATWTTQDAMLLLRAGYQHDDDSHEGNTHPYLVNVALTKNPHDASQMMNGRGTFPGTVMDTALSEKQKNHLAFRVLHHFFRSMGSCLSTRIVKCVCNSTFSHYRGKCYQEILDVTMTATDVYFQRDDEEMIAWGMEHVAQALSTLGRDMDAGNIYQEVAEEYTNDLMRKSWLIQMAASYFASHSDFAKAEGAFLKSLRTHYKSKGNRWVFDRTSCLTLQEWFMAYMQWGSVMSDEEENEFRARTFAVTLACLFSVAGLQTHIGPIGNTLLPLLKEKFRTKKDAMVVLDEAMRAPDVTSFRAIIWKCHDRSLADKLTPPKLPPDEIQSMTDLARDCQKDHIEHAEEMVVCGNPKCRATRSTKDGTAKHCACKLVYYCNKKCQRAAWAEHKHHCTYYAEKQKAKKQQQK